MANDPENAPGGEDPRIDSLEERIAAARQTEDQRIAQEHRVRPGYVTSRSVEEALNGAYCQALAEFKKALGSAELQETLRQEH